MGVVAPPAWFCIFVLTIISILHTNNFFAYHAPGAIAESLEQQYHITPQELGILFQVYSIPNVILVFVGGLMIDRWGANITSIATNTSMLLGMILFAVAPIDNPMPFFTIGRLLLGIGGETLCAAAQTMISKWFRGSYLTFGMGFAQAFVQLFGSATVFWILPRISITRIDLALWITAGVCGVSLLANLIYVFLVEPFFPQYLARNLNPQEWATAKSIDNYGSINQDELDDESESASNGVIVDPISIAVSAAAIDEPFEVESEPFSICGYLRSIGHSVTSLPTLFWLSALIQIWLSPILYTFTAFGPLYFQEKWNMSAVDAGSVTSVLYITIFFAPVFGFVIDRVGYRAIWQMSFSALIPCCFALMHFTQLSPYYAMALLGLLFSITEANGFAMVAVSVPEEVLGSAFGLCACGISFALIFEPYIVGWIKTSTGSFLISTWLFIGLSIAGWIFAVLTVWYDATHDCKMTIASTHTHSDEETYVYDEVDGNEPIDPLQDEEQMDECALSPQPDDLNLPIKSIQSINGNGDHPDMLSPSFKEDKSAR